MRDSAVRILIVGLLVGCDGGDGEPDAPPGDGPAPIALSFQSPGEGAVVLGSVVVDVVPDPRLDGVEVSIAGEATPRCTFAAPPFVCLIDLTAIAPGPLTVAARGLVAGAEVATATVAIERRGFATAACASGAPTACVAALVAAGQAAGYAGLSYHDMDDGHAVAGTAAMPGIETQINQAYAGTDPWHSDPARILIANQSQAYNFPDGWMSIPRNGSIAAIGTMWEASKLFLWPEHRDHGVVDFYPWQTPTLVLSQGSSGSELDEVAKLLHILAALPTDVRAALHTEHLLMPTVTMLHRRARVATDLDYLTPAAHTVAVADADVGREGVQLAASIRQGELPPIAGLTIEAATFPPDWETLGFRQQETGRFALVWAASAQPATPPAGTFSAIVDLAPASRDANARPLYFFARVIRGDAAHVRITQLSQGRFQIDAEWPAEVTAMINGHDRTTRRATVAFVAHNGVWLSPPAFLSVFGGAPLAHAPDANNLD